MNLVRGCLKTTGYIAHLYNNQINARALIGQSAMGYCYALLLQGVTKSGLEQNKYFDIVIIMMYYYFMQIMFTHYHSEVVFKMT